MFKCVIRFYKHQAFLFCPNGLLVGKESRTIGKMSSVHTVKQIFFFFYPSENHCQALSSGKNSLKRTVPVVDPAVPILHIEGASLFKDLAKIFNRTF